MKNKFEVLPDGLTVRIFLKRRNGDIINCHVEIGDLPKLQGFKPTWYAKWDNGTQSFYVWCNVLVDGKWTKIYMHNFIMEPPPGLEVNHKYHDTLDNRRSQLEIVTHRENCMNRKGATRSSKSGHRGISFDRTSGMFRFQATIDGKQKNIGWYSNVDDAIEARKAFPHYQPNTHGV